MEPNWTLYLDQCVISDLRTGGAHSDTLREVFSRTEGCAFVYSDIHVREILLSGKPLPFIEALEDIGACHLLAVETIEALSSRSAALSPNVVREKIPEEIDSGVARQLALEKLQRLLAPLHNCAGGTMSLDSERETVIAGLGAYVDDVEQEMSALTPPGGDIEPLLAEIQEQRRAAEAQMRSLDTQKMQQEAHDFQKEFARSLAKAKLDDVPDEEIAAILLSKLPDRTWVENTYPEGFGREAMSCGEITGFAYMLFTLGVGRLNRPMKGGGEEFVRRLYSQFRDCEHIEQAIRCNTFMTKDNGAASLAKAVYSYAGVPNQVIQLKAEKKP